MADSSKKMSLMGLTTLVMVNMMGSGIIMLPTSMAQLGAISLLSWIVTAVGSMAIAYCFSQCGIYCQRSGGLSAYTEEAHGKSGFFLCSYLYFLSLAIANVAVAISAVGYMTSFVPWLGSGAIPLFIGTVGLLWLTTVANFGGPGITGKIGAITVWGVIIPVAGLSIIGWFWFKSDVLVAAWNPNNLPISEAISKAIPLTLWAFLGMESAAQASDAVEESQAHRTAGLPVRHAGCGSGLRAVDDRHSGDHSQCRTGQLIGALRARLCANVQPHGRQHHHGAGGDGLCRLAAGLAVHPGANGQDDG